MGIIVKYMLKACWKGRHKTLGAVVSVIARLKKAKPEILTRIVDAVLEEIRFSIEHPSNRDLQRTVVYVKLLGELYTQALVTSAIVFNQLNDFINFGHDIPNVLHEISEKGIFHTANSIEVASNILKGPLGV